MLPRMGASLKLAGITREYAAPGGARLTVLRAIDLSLAAGGSVAIAGPSGSGKSTLLQIMGGLDRPTSGRIWLDERDLAALSELELARARNQDLGFVFQSHFLLPQCTAWENVLVPTLAGGAKIPGREPPVARAERLLERVGLTGRKHHRPGQLSGGERQRVAVVRALVNSPGLLLADEPTGALDHAAALELGQLLLELNREEGVTLVVVTHALSLAARLARAFTLRDGTLTPGLPAV